MQAPSGHMTAPVVRALLTDRTLAGEWALDPRTSSVRLKSRAMWGLVPVNGVFREVSGNGTVSPDGRVSGTVTVAAASIDTKNTRRDTHLRSADFFDSGLQAVADRVEIEALRGEFTDAVMMRVVGSAPRAAGGAR